ncbi:MAG: dihydrolipoyl dehydrogenase [Candidatus Fermentibacteraceae bacterium]
MEKREVVIIGAGTAGLTALSQVRKRTGDFVMINHGPYGTTCARVGCMPSKALIEAAGIRHKTRLHGEMGLKPCEEPEVYGRKVMERVRRLRDQFVKGVLEATDGLGEKNIQGRAVILEPDLVEVNGRRIRARNIIVAPGSAPVIPAPWARFSGHMLTSDTLFEIEDLPESLAVIGLGAIGLEMAQAMSRLGVRVEGFDAAPAIAGITDPLVSERAVGILGREFPVHLETKVEIEQSGEHVTVGGTPFRKILVAVGRKPNIEGLGLENLGVQLDARGLPGVNPLTMQVENLRVFLAGDANGRAPVLHEAADDGFIAGRNAFEETPREYCRRVRLGIVFTSPDIAVAGVRYGEIKKESTAVGEVDFSGQGRAITAGENHGFLRVYADIDTGLILGSEMVAPHGEHMAHLLAWAIQQKLTVSEALRMPFYHPVVEEGLRGALRNAAARMKTRPDEIGLCPGLPVE